MKKILIFLLFSQVACATNYKDMREKSPNFRNGQFHNPAPNDKSFWTFLKMRLNETYEKWPSWVHSTPGKINPERVDQGKTVHLTVINHSTTVIQVGGYNIMTDPIYSERCSPVGWAGPKRVRSPGIEFEKLPKIDIVLISHDHYDHLDLPTIQKLIERDNPKFFVGLGVGERFENMNNVTELDWWEQKLVDDKLKINFVPVQHFSGRTLFDRNSTLWGGFVIEVSGRKIYFGGDTGYAEHFKETHARYGSMDIAILPIGAYEPRDFMKYAHINPEEAVMAHLDLRAQLSIGVHYGTFQLTKEKITDPVTDLQRALEKFNLKSHEFLAPDFGKVIVVN